MLIHCPACGASIETAHNESALRVDQPCPDCGQRVVARDIGAAPTGGDHTVPFQPVPRSADTGGDLTAVPGRSPALHLPRDGRVSVVVLSGSRKGDVTVLSGPKLVIGREGGDADLQLPDAEISRRHAALECYGSRVVLRDLGSRNGTFVGGVKVPFRDVEDQAEFRLGATQLLLIVTERG